MVTASSFSSSLINFTSAHSANALSTLIFIGIATMRLPPLSVIETWPIPNYVDPVTRGSALLIFNAIFLPFVVIILAIRTYTRIHISKSFGWDDFLIILAAIPTGTYAILQLTALYHFEWNRHMWDIEVNGGIATGIKMIMAGQVAFALGSCLTKCSMLALTYRITSTGSSKLAPYIIGVIVLIVLENITFSFMVIFQCRPQALYWTLSFTPQNCFNEPRNLLAAGIINTITDLIVVILPMPTVWAIQLPRRETIIIILLFGAGLIITGAGAARTYYTYRVTVSNDKTWDIFPAWLTSCVELYIGIICASIPATKRFFSRYFPTANRSEFQPSTVHTNNSRASRPPLFLDDSRDEDMKVMASKGYHPKAVEDEEIGMEMQMDADKKREGFGSHKQKLSDSKIMLTPSSSKPDWPFAQRMDSDDELVTW